MRNKHKVGTVGARLHFENNTVQHVGIVAFATDKDQLGVTHLSLHSSYAYFDGAKSVAGNTGAFLLISKVLFGKIGGYNETYNECFEDVELNFECVKLKRINLVDHDAVCYHYESSTRGEGKGDRERHDWDNVLMPYIRNNINSIGQTFVNIKQ